MTAELKQMLTEDGSYDFVRDGEVVGRLLWITATCDDHPVKGWWLAVAGEKDKLISRVPSDLSTDLATARVRSRSMSLGLAYHMLVDRLDGLLDGPGEPAAT
jgi:hypothetical protein